MPINRCCRVAYTQDSRIMFTTDDSSGPVPMPGDCVLVDDRNGCAHCSDFAKHWDRYSTAFPDSMIRADATSFPPHMRRFVESSGGRVPTIMIVSSDESEVVDVGVSGALRKFIEKSAQRGHDEELFVDNIGLLSKRVAHPREKKMLGQLHDALQNELVVTRAIARAHANIGRGVDMADDIAVSQLEPSIAADIEAPPLPLPSADASEEIGSILDHLAIEEDGAYEGGVLY